MNMGSTNVHLPVGAEMLVASETLADGVVPTDTTAWFTVHGGDPF